MGEGHYRVLMLGGGSLVDRAAADLVADGLAVVQVVTETSARSMLDRGGFDVVIVDGADAAGMGALHQSGATPPWMVLQPTDAPRLAEFRGAESVSLPVTGSQLLALLNDVVAKARPQKARVTGNVKPSPDDTANMPLADFPDALPEGPEATV